MIDDPDCWWTSGSNSWRVMASAPMDNRVIEVREAGGTYGLASRVHRRWEWLGDNGRAKPIGWRPTDWRRG